MDVELLKSASEPPIAAELRALVELAQGGDATVLARIRQILNGYPEIWQYVGNLSVHVEQAWTAILAAHSPLAIECMQRATAEMRAELAGEHPTRLERLLVDQVVATWLQLKHVEAASADPPHGSLEQGRFRLRCADSAQKRHLAAVQTLTTVRALLPSGLAPAQAVNVHELKMQLG